MWTRTPPTEPGFYWTREAYDATIHVCELLSNGAIFTTSEFDAGWGFSAEEIARSQRQFWPERIEPPADDGAESTMRVRLFSGPDQTGDVIYDSGTQRIEPTKEG